MLAFHRFRVRPLLSQTNKGWHREYVVKENWTSEEKEKLLLLLLLFANEVAGR